MVAPGGSFIYVCLYGVLTTMNGGHALCPLALFVTSYSPQSTASPRTKHCSPAGVVR